MSSRILHLGGTVCNIDFHTGVNLMERNYQLAERLSKLGDDVFIGVEEVAALTGFAAITIQQRRVNGFPVPIAGPRKLRWRLGEIRNWGREPAPTPAPAKQKMVSGA